MGEAPRNSRVVVRLGGADTESGREVGGDGGLRLLLERSKDVRVRGGVLFIVVAVATGIIGNRSDAAFLRAVGAVYEARWALALVAFGAGMGIVSVAWWLVRATSGESDTIADLRQKLAASKKLADVSSSLLRLLPRMGMSEKVDEAAGKILEQFLADCITALGQKAFRAVIYLPSRTDPDLLVPGPSVGMIESHLQHIAYYVGADTNRIRGIAGQVFLSGGLQVIRFDEVGNKLVPDAFAGQYLEFGPARANLPYRSFVAIALPLSHTATTRHGVLCFDSAFRGSFDDDGIKGHVLPGMAEQAVAVIAIWRELAVVRARQGGTNGAGRAPTNEG